MNLRVAAILMACVAAQAAASLNVRVDAANELQIDPWGANSVRVRLGPKILDNVPWALLPPKESLHDVRVSEKTLVNGNLKAIVDEKTNLLSFVRVSDNKVLVQETKRVVSASPFGDYLMLNVTFAAWENERIYGLGEHKTGKLDNKGLSINLQWDLAYDKSNGGQIAIPFVTSNRGYGFFWNLPSFGVISFSNTSSYWSSEAAYQLDFWVTTTSGSEFTPSEISNNYADATGHAPTLPSYATGFFQSKDRYRNQSQLTEIVNGYLSRQLPLSVIIIDWFHWTDFGNYRFNPACWPNPKSMVEEFEKQGVKTMVTVWPLVDGGSFNYGPMKNDDFFVHCPSASPVDNCHGGAPYYLYDPTIPAARKYLWSQLEQGYYDNGIKIFWLDAAEPEQQSQHARHLYSIGPEELMGMAYELYHPQTFYDGMKSHNESEIFLLSRSAWAGSQRFGTAVWSGDTQSSFHDLAQQVRIGQNMGLSGIVWWTSDIGGYFGGNIQTPQFQELIVRWFQFGAFCPIFRLHGHRQPEDPPSSCGGSGGNNEVWMFGDTAYGAIKTVMLIREKLRPYIAKHMAIASEKGTPIMRPIWYNYPADENAYLVDDQFMFGTDYLVAPVIVEKATNRSVYLPTGTWKDWFTGKTYKGPQKIAAYPAPLTIFPLFERQD